MVYEYRHFKDDYDPYEDYTGHEDELAFIYSLNRAFEGDSEYQYIMGDTYCSDGQGVKVDLQKAEFWYLKAAAQGHLTAQCELGRLYSEGKLCKPDYEKAFGYFLKSARQGNFYAQTYAGIFLFEGKGCKRDIAEAAIWLEKGAKGGYAEAYYTLARIYAADKQKYEQNLKQAAGCFYAKALTDLCAFYLAEDRKQEAREVYLKAIKSGKEDAVKSFGGVFDE